MILACHFDEPFRVCKLQEELEDSKGVIRR